MSRITFQGLKSVCEIHQKKVCLRMILKWSRNTFKGIKFQKNKFVISEVNFSTNLAILKGASKFHKKRIYIQRTWCFKKRTSWEKSKIKNIKNSKRKKGQQNGIKSSKSRHDIYWFFFVFWIQQMRFTWEFSLHFVLLSTKRTRTLCLRWEAFSKSYNY